VTIDISSQHWYTDTLHGVELGSHLSVPEIYATWCHGRGERLFLAGAI